MSYRVKIHTPYLVELAKKCGMPPEALKKFENELKALNGDDTPAWDLLGSKLRKIEERLASECNKKGKPITIHQVGQWMEMALDWYYRFLSRDYWKIHSEIRMQEFDACEKDKTGAKHLWVKTLEDSLKGLKGNEWNAHDGIAKFPELYAALEISAFLACDKPDCGLRPDCGGRSCETGEELTARLAKEKKERKA